MKKFFYVLIGIILATSVSVWADRYTDYGALSEIPATGDLFLLVDVSDTTMAPTGTNKKIEYQYIINSNLATLRSPTASRIFYSNGSSSITEVALGTAYQICMMNSGATAPEFSSTVEIDGIRTSVTWQDATTPTKELQWDISSFTAGQTRVVTPPADANFTIVGTTATQTLTGKTYDANGSGNVLSNIDEDNCLDGSDLVTDSINVVLDGGGSALADGTKLYVRVSYACTIKDVTLLADQSGSVVVDIWKCTYSDFDAGSTHPVNGDSITASATPAISSATKDYDSTLSGWTVAITAGDILAFVVEGAATSITQVTAILKVEK